MNSHALGKEIVFLRNVGFFFAKRRGYFSNDTFWALQDVSFNLRKGETLGIVGRNGVGKSTLLQIIAGIYKPDRGTITNPGYKASLLSLATGFIQYLTGRENAILSGLTMGLKRREILARMDAIEEFAELGSFFDQPIETYSSGMRARLGFAVAFQIDPDILLVDEVLGVGDDAFREKSTREMRAKIQSDKTVVIVSHMSSLILELCDRAVLIDAGRTVLQGEPEEVLRAYEQSQRENNAAAPLGHAR